MNPQGSSSVCVVPTSTGKDLVTSKLSLECNVCGKKCATSSAFEGKCAKCANSSFVHV